ncbi:monocarboxylate transporter 6-like [Salvelinus namaycush]|uniref:Monocarboxylate transporter 6-like n=1 Tax=Salvelinus namaycush TaxID=8040 RepID=A0A8U0PTQ5_SALNM|nr:monocarboxylate transporter 6-like [Salvelinus namaycush]XP_038830609.1 monocarboxylate transporter 6-like [Salvelinus namaycush]XP_038830610.1 monocarboxylate transporter 6-like [Salvelinus namaycush]XP_038830611.1 monocarboxylate transporter 6-like [Salvelinus namaycush]XP_038830612.1 monocarboxylate transporter 6-like [Salvelinus namaycush]XP_038830613.1 monocarboxylate transporter 6-like [Salvelinus namaycush]XP_038830614.1 monocarboxylate transporter 6-like [Salvelinus namaycush]XP_0
MSRRNPNKVAGDCDSFQMESKAPEQAPNMEQKNGEIMDSEEVENGKSEPINPLAMDGAVTAPDGGWGWVVLVATILVLALTLAFPSCMGIFYTDLQTEFQASNQETSWVPSIMTSVLHAGGPFCSVLVERFGCRATVMLGGVLSGLGMVASSFTHTITELYVTAGIITGLGFCFSFQPAVTILGHYFVRRRAFANAMSSTGTALGLCTLPLLGNYLHTELGWRGSFLVLGAVLLNCCVCGAVMRPLGGPRHRGQPLINHRSLQLKEEKLKGRMRALWAGLMTALRRHMAFDLLRNNLRYRMYVVGITWMMLGFVVPLIYLVPYATAHDMEQSQAALLLSILGIVNIVVRPPIGLLFSLPWFKGWHTYVFSAALLLNGLSNSICCIDASFPVLLAYVVTYGLSMSVVGSLMFTVLMDTLDMSRFPAALGLLAIMESVTLLIGPPLAGILVDRTGEYFYVFFACSATVASSAVFLMVSFYWLDRRDRRALKEQQVPPQVPPPKPASGNNLIPQCQYRSVPTEGDKDKAPDSETGDVTRL